MAYSSKYNYKVKLLEKGCSEGEAEVHNDAYERLNTNLNLIDKESANTRNDLTKFISKAESRFSTIGNQFSGIETKVAVLENDISHFAKELDYRLSNYSKLINKKIDYAITETKLNQEKLNHALFKWLSGAFLTLLFFIIGIAVRMFSTHLP